MRLAERRDEKREHERARTWRHPPRYQGNDQMIRIEFDLSPWTDLLERVRAEAPGAIPPALNRAGDQVATVVVREPPDIGKQP